MPKFKHEGIELNYEIEGEGTPFLYLHGLGDNLSFVFETFQKPQGVKLIALDQRGHGRSEHDYKLMSFEKLADDAMALMNYLSIPTFFVGGLSMGAGVALNLAIHNTNRVLGLILIRASSTDEPMKEDVRNWFDTVSRYLPEDNGKQLFKKDPIFLSIQEVYPRAVSTFTRYFDDESSVKYPKKFVDMPNDTPIRSKEELKNISIPVLILSNKYDFIHPLEYSLFYKDNMKNVTYFELTSKTVNSSKHVSELNTAISNFIAENKRA